VIIGAKAVEIAVIETLSSTLPLESDEIKFDILPPGQQATSIIPRAIIGVIKGLRTKATAKVIAGRPTHCRRIPIITDFGFLKTSLKVSVLMPSATPNITKARIKFTIIIPPVPKLIVRLLKDSNCSLILFSNIKVFLV
jgi:hypothetical protein